MSKILVILASVMFFQSAFGQNSNPVGGAESSGEVKAEAGVDANPNQNQNQNATAPAQSTTPSEPANATTQNSSANSTSQSTTQGATSAAPAQAIENKKPAVKETPAKTTQAEALQKIQNAKPAKANNADLNTKNSALSAGEEKSETTTPQGPVEIPQVKKSIIRTAKSARFSKGLYFDQLNSSVMLPPMQFEYDLTLQNGAALSVGNVLLSENNFFFALTTLGKAHPDVAPVLKEEERGQYYLIMRWPELLLNTGTVEMISKRGTVLWKHEITKEMRDEWTKRVNSWRSDLKLATKKDVKKSGLFATQYAEPMENIPLQGQKEIFRFCVTQVQERAQTKVCSRWYGTKNVAGRGVIMGKAKVDAVTPRALVQNETAPLKDDKPVSADMPTSFFAELLGGETYEFVAQPNKLNLMDIADTVKPNVLRVIGYETRPTSPSLIINPDQYSSFTKMIGFEATIGDTRKFWIAPLRRDKPQMYLPGQGGGVFKQVFELADVPKFTARPYVDKNTPKETYYDDFKIYGRKLPDVQVNTDQNSVEVASNKTEFTWNFRAQEKGQINRSYLNLEYEGKIYKSYYEVYRGYARELSARFTGVVSGGQASTIAEIAYNQWFENFIGSTDYWFGRQRWGLSAKAFQTMSKIRVDSAGTTASLEVMNAELKYRVTPGLWGREETIGPMASYQSVKYGNVSATMLGAGGFWARSMPRIFDDFLNEYIPFMNYPKWVDMEFIYYPLSLNSSVKVDSTLSLNFHGKVLWTQNIFGEAGFGLKRYSFLDQASNTKATLNAFYGTVGLGISF